MANFFAQRIAELKGKTPGEEITEITEVNPEGKTISTKSFKGKVLLIDFWASWCGPCRRVNPHLVQLYNKYKSAGFEVLGVSLDKSKDAWVQAIQQDGLTWSHVSDLGFWQSKWAKAYGVSSIPYAVLVDKEGKLIAAGIQPQELDQKLAQLFGF
jgi:thiol-disulfide isomerase/thioredoxin